MGVIALSAFLAHTGWHWFLERGADTLQYDFVLPVVNAALLATLFRWLMLGLIVLATAWGLRGLYGWVGRRFGAPGSAPPASPISDPRGPAVSEG
jgi:hypothetical protein